jgi:hypothetical protein
MLMHSPSTPTTISVRFLFLIPLMLHTPVACIRPLVELTGFDSEASVNGAPISLSDDIVRVGSIVCSARSAKVAVPVAFATSRCFSAGTF